MRSGVATCVVSWWCGRTVSFLVSLDLKGAIHKCRPAKKLLALLQYVVSDFTECKWSFEATSVVFQTSVQQLCGDRTASSVIFSSSCPRYAWPAVYPWEVVKLERLGTQNVSGWEFKVQRRYHRALTFAVENRLFQEDCLLWNPNHTLAATFQIPKRKHLDSDLYDQ